MWYFTWILGVLLACAFGIINVLWLEAQEGMDQQTAVLDPLTKLPVRTEFLNALEEKVLNCKDDFSTFTMLLVGLNAFQRMSQDGDNSEVNKLVLGVADIIKQETRQPLDTVCRYDAATFAIILPAAESDAARAIAQRICERTDSQTSMSSTEPVVSIGIAEYPADIDFATNDSLRNITNTLLKTTDIALKNAQKKGMNSVCCAANNPNNNSTDI
jgi:cyd operon protein YbgT